MTATLAVMAGVALIGIVAAAAAAALAVVLHRRGSNLTRRVVQLAAALREMAAADLALAAQDRDDLLRGTDELTPAYAAATDRVAAADAAVPRPIRWAADRVIFWWHQPQWTNVWMLADELNEKGYGRDET